MTLSRKGFFSGLLAMASAIIAKAQTSGPGATIITPCRPKIQWGNQLPLCNGQCPQPDCGYRAPELPKRELTKAEDIEAIKLGVVYWEVTPDDKWIPTKRLNRCPNCNTAFWQDPEPPAKEG